MLFLPLLTVWPFWPLKWLNHPFSHTFGSLAAYHRETCETQIVHRCDLRSNAWITWTIWPALETLLTFTSNRCQTTDAKPRQSISSTTVVIIPATTTWTSATTWRWRADGNNLNTVSRSCVVACPQTQHLISQLQHVFGQPVFTDSLTALYAQFTCGVRPLMWGKR